MFINRKSEIKIMSFILITFFTVVITGILAYRGFQSIVAEVSHSSEPDIKLALVKQIVSDISDAGSNVKTYNFTHDVKYLTKFYNSTIVVDKNISDLKLLIKNNVAQKNLVDTLEVLTGDEYSTFNELLSLRPDENITNELTRISDKMAEENKRSDSLQKLTAEKEEVIVPDQEKLIPIEKEKTKKRSLFKGLFKKAEKVQDLDSSVLVKEQNSQEQRRQEESKLAQNKQVQKKQAQNVKLVQKNIRVEIEKVNQEHIEEQRLVKDMEFKISNKSEVIMYEIYEIAAKIENIEKKEITKKIQAATKRAKETNILVASFCFMAGLLLIIVSLVLIKYLQKKKAYEKGLKEGKKQAELLAHSKEIFLANMSHEIRTPMNAIVGFTNQILETDLKPEQREQLKIVQKSNDHLLKIINEILDYSKMEAGKFNFESVSFNPDKVLKEVIELSGSLLKNKQVKINYSIVGQLPEFIVGDQGRLRQIVLNLVSNSIKFTEDGEINIKTEFKKDVKGKSLFYLYVNDTGIGIPKNKLNEIFGEFQQAHNSIYHKYGGTGLGLPITKKLVELQNGTIKIESTEGKGTTVIVSIPYTIGQLPEKIHEENKKNVDEELLSHLKILIADDDEYNRKLLHTILSKWNVQIGEAKNGLEVLDEVTKNSYDILLLDIRMPEMSGTEATEKIRKLHDRVKANIPIIALTAVTSDEKKQRCKDIGINDFLSKPFNEDDLLVKITSLTGINKTELISETLNLKNNYFMKNETHKLINLDELKRVSNGDDKFISEMINVFIKTSEDGMSNIEKALQEKNYKVIADYAHKIAPPCRHIGADTLLDTLKKIESYARDLREINDLKTLLTQARNEMNDVIRDLRIENLKLSK
jgi:signal transduction histidine kinase/DNA-binding NarL/FixJ family response regulator